MAAATESITGDKQLALIEDAAPAERQVKITEEIIRKIWPMFEVGFRGKKAHIRALDCDPKVVSALVCSPKLVCALVCALLCAPKLLSAPKLLCAPKLVCALVCDLNSYVRSYVLQNSYERSYVRFYVLPNSHVRLSVLPNAYVRPYVRSWGVHYKTKIK